MKATVVFPVTGVHHGDPGLLGFVRATFSRITWLKTAVAAAIVIVSWMLSSGSTMPVDLTTPGRAPPSMFLTGVVINLICGACLLVAVMAADEAVARGSGRLRTYVLAVVIGSLVGGILQYQVRLLLDLRSMLSDAPTLVRITQPVYVALMFMLDGGVVTFVYVSLRTARLAATRHRDAEIARARARRGTLESRLQAMQARVEPTFLFNTLAQVRELYESDAVLAGRMLDDLIAYLRAALPHIRETSSTLGKEIELARAYLDIMRMRLGDRLSFDIEVPASMHEFRMPPMMLLPLIDHALVYGLGPAREGGTIRIATSIVGNRIRLSIADGGVGFLPGSKLGHLAQIEARLDALYGTQADFQLRNLQADGCTAGSCVILEIPHEPHDGGHR